MPQKFDLEFAPCLDFDMIKKLENCCLVSAFLLVKFARKKVSSKLEPLAGITK